MDFEYYIKELWYKIIYVFVVIVYLFFLNGLNDELLAHHFDSSFDLLEYKDYIALKFFAIAAVLFIIGGLLIYLECKKLKIGLDSVRDIAIAVATIIVYGILLLLIFDFINNPILRAIVVSMAVIVVGAKMLVS